MAEEEAALTVNQLVEQRLRDSERVAYIGHHEPSDLEFSLPGGIIWERGDVTNHVIAPHHSRSEARGMKNFMRSLEVHDLQEDLIPDVTDYPRTRDLRTRDAAFSVGRFFFQDEQHPPRHLTVVSVYPEISLTTLLMKGVRLLDKNPPNLKPQIPNEVQFLHNFVPKRRDKTLGTLLTLPQAP